MSGRGAVALILAVCTVVVLAATNPSKAEYVAWLKDEAVAQESSLLAKGLAAVILPIVVDTCTVARNYVLFTVFTTSLDGSTVKCLGILRHFFPLPGSGTWPDRGESSAAPAAVKREAQANVALPGGGWRIEFERLIGFPGHREYLVVAASRLCEPGVSQLLEGQVFLCRPARSADQVWEVFWRSPVLDQLDTRAFYGIHALIRPDIAIVAPEFNLGGAHGLSHVMVLGVTPNGNVSLEADMTIGNGEVREERDAALVVVGEGSCGMHVFLPRGGSVVHHSVPRSQMAPAGARQVGFLLADRNGKKVVVPAEQAEFSAKVGDVVAFVPRDEATTRAFDEGEIEIYTDAWNGPPLSACEANRLKLGNSYCFSAPGVYYFVLVHSDYWNALAGEDPILKVLWGEDAGRLEEKPTFVVTVVP